MLKKITGTFAAMILFSPIVFAKIYNPNLLIELDDEFLNSLNTEQRDYLELVLANSKDEAPERSERDDEYIFINMDRIELLSKSANPPTTGTQPQK